MKITAPLNQTGMSHQLILALIVVVAVASFGAWRVFASSALTAKYVIVKNSGKGAADNIRVNAGSQNVKVGSKVNALVLHGRISVNFRGIPKTTYDNQELYKKDGTRFIHVYKDGEKGQYTVKYPNALIGASREQLNSSGPTTVDLCRDMFVQLESYYVQACTLSSTVLSVKAAP